jgi:hypothetical protein
VVLQCKMSLMAFSTVVTGRQFGRYWGKSRHGRMRWKVTRMTHSVISPSSIFALRKDHSITSSARPSSWSGNVIPSAFAVLRFITNSTFTACTTGKSAGFVHLRMRAM